MATHVRTLGPGVPSGAGEPQGARASLSIGEPTPFAAPDSRPLTARSVLASTLLGTRPPTLPVRALIRAGALFGMTEGTVRTALSRMVAAGEATRDGDGRYALAGELVERQHRQDASRAAATLEWSGAWRQAIVEPGARHATDRAALRRSMARLRMAELRDGVWLRPDNLPGDRLVADREQVAPFTRWFAVHPDADADLAPALWDLDGWATTARRLRRELHDLGGRLRNDPEALAPGFVLSAAVLRHFNADPLLPRELLDRAWPGDALRADYERYDAAYRSALQDWLRAG